MVDSAANDQRQLLGNLERRTRGRGARVALIHGAAGGVGSIAVQLAREVGARVIGTGRAADRDTVLGLGVDAFLDLQANKLEDAGEVDVAFDVIGGEILDRSAALVRAGGTLVTTIRVPTVQPKGGRAVFFVVEADRSRLADLAPTHIELGSLLCRSYERGGPPADSPCGLRHRLPTTTPRGHVHRARVPAQLAAARPPAATTIDSAGTSA